MNETRNSILQMAKGAFEERVDYEMTRALDNILNLNTKATAKREIALTIELTPDDERQTISVAVQTKATLAPTNPVATALRITRDGDSEMVVDEMVPQIPGQKGRPRAAPRPLDRLDQNTKPKGRST